jgi:hypothetical protein
MQLSEELITALDRTGSGKVDELHFVVEMIIALGAEVCGEKLDFKSHVQPLIDRFAVLDEDDSGYLTKEDITFMLTSARAQAEQESDHSAPSPSPPTIDPPSSHEPTAHRPASYLSANFEDEAAAATTLPPAKGKVQNGGGTVPNAGFGASTGAVAVHTGMDEATAGVQDPFLNLIADNSVIKEHLFGEDDNEGVGPTLLSPTLREGGGGPTLRDRWEGPRGPLACEHAIVLADWEDKTTWLAPTSDDDSFRSFPVNGKGGPTVGPKWLTLSRRGIQVFSREPPFDAVADCRLADITRFDEDLDSVSIEFGARGGSWTFGTSRGQAVAVFNHLNQLMKRCRPGTTQHLARDKGGNEPLMRSPATSQAYYF